MLNDLPSGVSILRQRMEAENAAKREQFDASLKKLFAASFDDPKSAWAHLLRMIVEYNAWFVPVDASGEIKLTAVPKGKYRLAIDPDPPKRHPKDKGGHGGQLMSLFFNQPHESNITLDGREIVRRLDSTLDGVLIWNADGAPRELPRQHFAALHELATAYTVEAMLLTPAPDQVNALKQATWLVEMNDNQPAINSSLGKGRMVHAYTHADRAMSRSHAVKPMTGAELFAHVASNEQIDGVLVNLFHLLDHGGTSINQLVLSPAFAVCLSEGMDIRAGANPLPARNHAEIELWLALHDFPSQDRQLITTHEADRSMIQAISHHASYWRVQETAAEQRIGMAPTTSPMFALPPHPDDGTSAEIAAGASQILCAGLLAKQLNAQSIGGADAEQFWNVGLWLGFGRYVRQWERELSLKRLKLANELVKLLPNGANEIPRSALLTVEGAAFLANYPHARTRAWIEATARRAQQFTRRWA